MKKYAERRTGRDRSLIAINSGANLNFDRLRHIADRAEIGEHREALLAVTIPEQPGSYRAFIQLLGTRAITDFEFDWGRDGVYCPSCNGGAGNARMAYIDNNHDLWVGNVDVLSGDLVPNTGQGVLVDNNATTALEIGNGAPATLVTTTAAYPGYPERIEITGTKGFAALIGGRLRLAFLDGREEIVEAEGSTGSGAAIMDFPHDAHRAVIADFLDAIERGRDPVVTGEEALASQRLVDDILAAARGGA